MSSGRIQLTAVGIQDQFLTGTPDISYFIKRFNRHTKFALEILNTTFNQTNINFGSWVNVIIPRNGQLIRNMYVRLVLPALTTGSYVDAVGNAIIEYADLVIGGQTIERINGEYMQIYDQFFISDSQQASISYMVGPTLVGGLPTPAQSYIPGMKAPEYGWFPRTFIVPLQFYFAGNEPLSLPLCALTRQEVEVRIKFRPFEQLIKGGYSSITKNVTSNFVQQSYYYNTFTNNTFDKIQWLPRDLNFAYIPIASLNSNVYYYGANTGVLAAGQYSNQYFTGRINDIVQNKHGDTIILSDANSSASNNLAYSSGGIAGQFYPSTTGGFGGVTNFTAGASDGTNFACIANVYIVTPSPFYNYTISTFSAPFPLGQGLTADQNTGWTVSTELLTISWSPLLNAFVVGDVNGVMYTYTIGAGGLTIINGAVGPYTCYSNVFGQVYNTEPIAASDQYRVLATPNQWSNDNINFTTYSITPLGTNLSIAANPNTSSSNVFAISGQNNLYFASPVSSPQTDLPVPTSQFQASLPVEYVFLSDEEVGYIQNAKIDYVMTQLQMASVVVPANETQLNGYRLNFINPVKELFFTIQDSNVFSRNDYWNYFNNSDPFNNLLEQLVNLDLQFNGEDVISSTVADNLYLGKVQILNNHTRLPTTAFRYVDVFGQTVPLPLAVPLTSIPIYNYSFAIDPENYLPTGQVNMSRIINQNLWINLTPNTVSRIVNIYARSYNILRVQNGLAGMIFMDNNMSVMSQGGYNG
jgi:hypothetical protein